MTQLDGHDERDPFGPTDDDEEYDNWGEYWADDANDPTICYDCGCPGRFQQGGEYKCPNCGNVWDV